MLTWTREREQESSIIPHTILQSQSMFGQVTIYNAQTICMHLPQSDRYFVCAVMISCKDITSVCRRPSSRRT